MEIIEEQLTAEVMKLLNAYGQWVREQALRPTGSAQAISEPTRADNPEPARPKGQRFDVRFRPDLRPRPGVRAIRYDGETEATEAVPVTARSLEGQAFEVLGPDGQPVLELSAEMALRYHGNAAYNKLRVKLRVVEEVGDAVRLVADVLPGPTKEAMTLEVDIGGERREFVVQPHAGTPRQLTSGPCESLPRSAVGLGDGVGEWVGSVEVRRMWVA